MRTIHSSGTSVIHMNAGLWRAAILLLSAALCPATSATAQETKAAVWKVQEIYFLYRSTEVIYSCSDLRSRVKAILIAVGARDDLFLRVSECDGFISPSSDLERVSSRNPADRFRRDSTRQSSDRQQQASHVRVRLLMPVEVTPQILTELDKDKSRRELISRVSGNRQAKYDDPVVFTAQWQPVTLSKKSLGLEPADCELLEQMALSIFGQLNVKVTRKTAACDKDHVSRFPPEVTVEALMGTTAGAARLPQMPPASQDDSQPAEAQ